MLKKIIFIFVILNFIYVLPGYTENVQKSNLTFGMVNSKIIKDKTTQTEVLELLGSPNIITKDKDNHEVWTYEQVSYEDSEKTGSCLSFSKSKSVSGSKTATLIIKFNENNVVKDYSMTVSKF